MADKPWSGRVLTPGQIKQLLETKGCLFIKSLPRNAELWRAPSGRVFTISLSDCDDKHVEIMMQQIEEWVNDQ
jgi:hypothetical protein